MAACTEIQTNGIIFCLFIIYCGYASGASPIYTFNGTYRASEVKAHERNVHLVNATAPIIYEGKSFSQFIISKDGLIVFTTDKSAVVYHTQDWSLPDVAPFIDLPFIAPYYHRGQPLDSLKKYAGHVYFKIFQNDDKFLLNLGQYVREQVVGSTHFIPTWGIAITWEKVTSERIVEDGPCKGTVDSPCPTNTFQLVLVTDGTQSYAIFNYGEMQMSPSKYSQAGFNGGKGTGFTNIVPESKSIRDMNRFQGSDKVGRFIFRISAGKVVRGGCSDDPSYNMLSVAPNYAGMFGGKMIDISGPCFTRNQQILCKFEDPNHATQASEVKATYVSQTRVRCMVPRLLVRDRVILSLSTNNGNTYLYSTEFTIVFPGRMPHSEHVTAVYKQDDLGWYSHNPTTLTLTWNSVLLSNSTSDRVDINLIGYREENGVAMYAKLATLGNDIPVGKGRFELNPQEHQCSGQNCYSYEVGLVEVKLQDQYIPHSYKYLSTKAVPLGWYVQNAMTAQHGQNWPSSLCRNWYGKDSKNTEWVNSLLHCPCSLAQAIADFGRWQQDNGCNLDNTESAGNCFYHQEAVHCVRAVQPVKGAGNQCCYGKTGHLIFAADTFQGSTPDKSHDWGAVPYGTPGYVPSLSHWIDDVITFYYCCLWDGYNSCDYYMDLRPTRDCTGYNPPIPASVYGQGHIATFDGQKIRMLGPGDYILLRVGSTEVHARFQRNLFKTEYNATVQTTFSLSAVAVQNRGTSDRVELRLRGPNFDTKSQHIDVLVNGQFIEFNEGAMKWQDFKGIAVVNTDKKMVKSNFTVLLTNGVGFQVAEIYNTLQLDLMMPADSSENITGLLGDLDGNKMLSNGSIFKINADDRRELYNKFELAWAVNETTTLFSDILPANHSIFGPVELYPTEMPGHTTDNSICAMQERGYSDECIFDLRYTGSREIARATKDAAVRYAALSANLQPVRSCGLLNVPRSKKSNYGYTIGTKTTITECRTGSLSGSTTYTCVATSNETQQWSPEVTATCDVKTESADIGMIVGIVVGVVFVVLIAIVVAIVAVRKRRQQERIPKRSGEAKDKEEEEAMKTAV